MIEAIANLAAGKTAGARAEAATRVMEWRRTLDRTKRASVTAEYPIEVPSEFSEGVDEADARIGEADYIAALGIAEHAVACRAEVRRLAATRLAEAYTVWKANVPKAQADVNDAKKQRDETSRRKPPLFALALGWLVVGLFVLWVLNWVWSTNAENEWQRAKPAADPALAGITPQDIRRDREHLSDMQRDLPLMSDPQAIAGMKADIALYKTRISAAEAAASRAESKADTANDIASGRISATVTQRAKNDAKVQRVLDDGPFAAHSAAETAFIIWCVLLIPFLLLVRLQWSFKQAMILRKYDKSITELTSAYESANARLNKIHAAQRLLEDS